MDLAPGTVDVELTVPTVIPASAKFEECTPFAFSFGSFTPSLTLTSVSPSSVSTTGGTTITLTGAGFDAATTVTIDGLACTSAVVVTSTTLTCSTPTLSAGVKNIVITKGVLSATLTGGLSVAAPSAAVLTMNLSEPFNYGNVAVGASVNQTFTLTNSGGLTATALVGGGLAAPFTFLGGAYPGTGGTCAATLGSSATCTVVVNYSPGASGAHSDTIQIDYHDGVAPQTVTRTVQGVGITPAVLSISDGPTYDYGIQATGSSSSKTFTITNTSSSTATSLVGSGLSAPFTFSGGSYPGTGGTCASTLGGGSTCTVVVVYAPTATGFLSDSLDISYYDGLTTQSVSRAVQGNGATPAYITATPGSHNFPLLASGGSSSQTFTLTNSGAVSASSLTPLNLDPPYSFLGEAIQDRAGHARPPWRPVVLVQLSSRSIPRAMEVFLKHLIFPTTTVRRRTKARSL